MDDHEWSETEQAARAKVRDALKEFEPYVQLHIHVAEMAEIYLQSTGHKTPSKEQLVFAVEAVRSSLAHLVGLTADDLPKFH